MPVLSLAEVLSMWNAIWLWVLDEFFFRFSDVFLRIFAISKNFSGFYTNFQFSSTHDTATCTAVQHERKPLLEKKEHASSGNASLHNANDTNSNNTSGGKFSTNNISNLSSILPAHLFANFTSNLAQQGKFKNFEQQIFGWKMKLI